MRYQNSNRRQKSSRGMILALAAVLLMIAAVVFFTSKSAAAGNLERNAGEDRRYVSYTIQPGDSLWSIADEFCAGTGTSRQDYIDEVCRINHLGDGSEIYSGNNIIAYYPII